MALSRVMVLQGIRDLVAAITAITDTGAVFGAGGSDETGLPAALAAFPAVVVLPGATVEYVLSGGQHRHTYEVRVLVFGNQGGDIAQTTAQVVPLADAIIAKFSVNVGGSWANSCVFERASGFEVVTYAGVDYLGEEIVLRVSEQASASPAKGA